MSVVGGGGRLRCLHGTLPSGRRRLVPTDAPPTDTTALRARPPTPDACQFRSMLCGERPAADDYHSRELSTAQHAVTVVPVGPSNRSVVCAPEVCASTTGGRSAGTLPALVESQNESSRHDTGTIHRERLHPPEGGPEMQSNDLTLVFSEQALEKLTRPKRAFDDIATWASHVGIVSSEPSFIERRRVREASYQYETSYQARGRSQKALSTLRG